MDFSFLTATTDAAATGAEGAAAAGPLALIVNLLPMVLIIVVFYFILIRPQRKKDKQLKAMIDAIKVGDSIVTIGGIHGKVVRIKDATLFIESTTDKTKLQIERWAVKDVTKYVEDDE